MKIGILTFYCAHNYGAVLQAYALQEHLKSLGHQVEFIKYEPEYLLSPYRISPKLRGRSSFYVVMKGIVKSLLTIFYSVPRRNAFNRFISEKLNVSTRSVTTVDDISGYDAYIVGSDQVWNPKITKVYDPVYWLDIKDRNCLKISYAASISQNELIAGQEDKVSKFLSNIDSISVREKQAQELLQPLVNKQIETVLDPALLVDLSVWENLGLTRPTSEKYVLVYYVGYSPSIDRIANNIAKEIGAKVVTLVPHPTFKNKKGKIQTASPIDFVRYFKYADFVVTSSFHGTVFATIFNRPFYTVEIKSLKGGSSTRMKSLLSDLGLDSRLVDEDSSPKSSSIDFAFPNKKLEELRAKSRAFLSNALK